MPNDTTGVTNDERFKKLFNKNNISPATWWVNDPERSAIAVIPKTNTAPPPQSGGSVHDVLGDSVIHTPTIPGITVDVGNTPALTGVTNAITGYDSYTTTTYTDVGISSISVNTLPPPTALQFTDSRGNVVGKLDVDEVNCRLVFEGDANESALRLFSYLASTGGLKLKHTPNSAPILDPVDQPSTLLNENDDASFDQPL